MTQKERERTTINLPVSLLQDAKIRAIRERIDLQDLIASGIRLYLKKKEALD